MSLYDTASQNVRKTWFLMLTFLVFIIFIGWIFSQAYGNPIILYIAVLFSLIMNITSYWYSDRIVLKLTGAKEANRKEHFTLYTTVENLAITAGLPMPKVYIIDDPAPNAFATGRDPKHAVVAVTTGLLSILNKTELEGVIAHELSHIKNRDILVGTVAVVLAGFIAIISDLFLRMSLFGGLGRDRDSKSSVFIIITIIAAILAPIAASLIQLAISRKREFLADASGALLTRYPEGLASALKKISANSRPLKRANNATAHLFISNPFGKLANKNFVAKLFMTHPPTEERIKALLGTK